MPGCRYELHVILKVRVSNDPKLTLSPTTSNIYHICVTSIHESQHLFGFALRTAAFETQASLKKNVHQMPPPPKKWRWKWRSKVSHICITSIPKCQILSYFLYDNRFRDTKLSEMHQVTSECPWTLTSQKYRVNIKHQPLGSKVLSVSLYYQLFSR